MSLPDIDGAWSRPRWVRTCHTGISVAAAVGDTKKMMMWWNRAPVQYRAVMSLCMYLGRLKGKHHVRAA